MVNRHTFSRMVVASLLPELNRKGFEVWRPKGKAETLIIHFRRGRANRLDLVDIQFDKHGRLGCFVNIAQLDAPQIATQYEGVLPADQVTTAHLRDRCRLWGNSFFGMFKPTLSIRLFAPGKSGYAVGTEIAARFNEVEDWFESRRMGKYIRCYRL